MIADGAVLRRLSAVRIVVATLMLLRLTPLVALLPHVGNGESGWWGWPDGRWTTTLGPSLPMVVVRGSIVVRTIAAAALLVGARARWAGIVLTLASVLVVSQDAFAATHTLRLLAIVGVLVAIDGGCSRAWLPDRPIAPTASLWLLRAFVVSVYAWSVVAKLNADWISGRTLGAFYRDGLVPGLGASFALSTPRRCAATAIGVLGFEAALGPALLHPRTRRIGWIVAIGFHVALEIVVRPDVFGLIMIALLAAFTSTDRARADPPQS